MSEQVKTGMKARNIRRKLITHFFLILGVIVMLVPFLWMLTTSLKTEQEAFIFPPEMFGERLVFENYLRISDRFNYFGYFLNSIQVSAWVVFFQLFTSSMAGFVFARLNFRGREKIFLLYLATMMVPFHVTTITNFITMTNIGLVGTLWSLMVPPMVSAFGTFLLRQFFITIPKELDEAARIDGCNPFRMFVQIFLPMAGPSLATLAIFCFMSIWNDYFTPLVYITDQTNYTLPLGLATMKGMYSTNWPVLMAASTVSVLPVLIAFLCAQDAFVKGVALSGMKE